MKPLKKKEFLDALVAQLRVLNPDLPAAPIGEDDNLFDLGYVDSLKMIELTVWIQKSCGASFNPGDYDPQHFYSLRAIHALIESITPRKPAAAGNGSPP